MADDPDRIDGAQAVIAAQAGPLGTRHAIVTMAVDGLEAELRKCPAPLATMGRDIYPSPFMGVGLVSAHGYPPDTPGIQGVLYAWGNGIARGREIKGARMIDIHPTVTRLLEIHAQASQEP